MLGVSFDEVADNCAFSEKFQFNFPLLCDRMLHRRPAIAVTYLVFDVLVVDGHAVLGSPFGERRARPTTPRRAAPAASAT